MQGIQPFVGIKWIRFFIEKYIPAIKQIGPLSFYQGSAKTTQVTYQALMFIRIRDINIIAGNKFKILMPEDQFRKFRAQGGFEISEPKVDQWEVKEIFLKSQGGLMRKAAIFIGLNGRYSSYRLTR